MKKILIISAAAVATLAIAWSVYEQRRNREVVATLQTWMGKEITYPSCPRFITADTTVWEGKNGYTIFYCIDSTGCTACRLHLEMWVHFMNELNTASSSPVKLVFVTNVSDERNVRMAFTAHPEFTVINTWNDTTGNLKDLPCRAPINTFLLDSENKIITIGNPLVNNKVKSNYYKKIILTR